MPAYAIAQLRHVDQNAEIVEYLNRIDATLAPYGGRFRVHGTTPEVADGELPGTIVLIEFPDVERVRAWYASPEYQEILPLRTRNSEGGVAVLEGVPDGYRAASYAAKLAERNAAD
jgi:uncharacterized protein (DUF1330 family)